MTYKDDAAASRVKKLNHYADGGSIGDDYAVNGMSDVWNKSRSASENKYIESTRKYPFRFGLGPAASEDHLSGKRTRNMRDAQDISDKVPRRTP